MPRRSARLSKCSTAEPQPNKSHEVSYAWLPRIPDDDDDCLKLKNYLYCCIGPLSCSYTIVDVYRKHHYSRDEEALQFMFRFFEKAMAAKRGGNANVVHACRVETKVEFDQIMSDGFIRLRGFGRSVGLHFYPLRFVRHSVDQSLLSVPHADADGLTHLVFYRIILGRLKEIDPRFMPLPGYGPFDSGVLNLESHQKYIVWYKNVKTNVLPLLAISVKLDIQSGVSCREPKEQLTWKMSADLVHVLSGVLPQSSLPVIWRLRLDFLEKKINEEKFLSSIWEVLGDKTSEAGNLLKKDNILKMLFQDEDAAAAAKFVAHLNDASGEARKVEHSGIQREVKREVDNGDFPPGGFGDVNDSRQQCAEDLDKYAKSLELKLEETGEPLV